MQITSTFRPLASCLCAFLGFATVGRAQVAVLWAGDPLWQADVVNKILGSSVPVGPVTSIHVGQGSPVPSVAQLQAFRAVLVYSSPPFGDSVQLGNNLHDYVDLGGGVVIGAFANVNPGAWSPEGTWASEQYEPIELIGQPSTVPLVLGTRHVPDHPLFQVSPVVGFLGGASSYHGAGGLAPNSTRLADWSDGSLFAAERNGLAGRVLSLNFYLPSSDCRPDLWLAGSDGDNLMANALAYAGHFECSVVTAHCTAKVNSLGCTPAIGYKGMASASASWGFDVRAANVRNQKAGLLFYGFAGQASQPFQGGTLCVHTPIKRTVAVHSGGTALPASDCSGVYSIDMNAFARGLLGGSPHALLSTPGTAVNCQWWGRDPGFPPPNNTTLSNALQFMVCP